jgi:hypothetical protein
MNSQPTAVPLPHNFRGLAGRKLTWPLVVCSIAWVC